MVAIVGCLTLLVCAPWAARAQEGEIDRDPHSGHSETTPAPADEMEPGSEATTSGPVEDVREAAAVIRQMRTQTDGDAAQLLEQARGVFVVPDYATAALLAGVSGGEGVLLTKRDGEWGNPAFYDIGRLSVGVQVGAAAGSIVLVLMSDKAVESFKQEENTFSLTADAGLSIVNWSAWAQGEVGREGDIVMWTDVEGLMGAVAVGVSGVSWDEEENAAYYGRPVTMAQILEGEVKSPHEDEVKRLLSEAGSGDRRYEAMSRDADEMP
jgi:lipid-binding SYLF domain-containing protein